MGLGDGSPPPGAAAAAASPSSAMVTKVLEAATVVGAEQGVGVDDEVGRDRTKEKNFDLKNVSIRTTGNE